MSNKSIRFTVAVMTLVLVGCVDKSSDEKSQRTVPRPNIHGGKVKKAADRAVQPQPQDPQPAVVNRQPADHSPVRQPDPQPQPKQPERSQPVSRTPVAVPATSLPAASVPPIHLSAGAMLPVSLPQGTTMSFTAEYQASGALKSGVRYVLVITDRRGRAIKAPLPGLRSRGQLPGLFTRQFRPEDAPFQGFIEEYPVSTSVDLRKPGKRVSNVVPLR